VLYALALVPVGFLADRADRPRLLAGGLTAWSLLTMAASKARPVAATVYARAGSPSWSGLPAWCCSA